MTNAVLKNDYLHDSVEPVGGKASRALKEKGWYIVAALVALVAIGGVIFGGIGIAQASGFALPSFIPQVMISAFKTLGYGNIGIVGGGLALGALAGRVAYLAHQEQLPDNNSPIVVKTNEPSDPINCNVDSNIPDYYALSSYGNYSSEFIRYKTKVKNEFGDEALWIQFTSDKSTGHYHKFHISINRQQMAEAYYTIFPFLMTYQVEAFKILHSGALDEGNNTLGKEIVLYTPKPNKENMRNWKELFQDIIYALENKGISPGVHPSGTILIEGGEGFIYSRSSHNKYNYYIPANCYEDMGFTRVEFATIRDSAWFSVCSEQNFSKKRTPPHVSLKEINDLNNEFSSEIKEIFLSDLSSRKNSSYPTALLKMIVGLERGYVDAPEVVVIDTFFQNQSYCNKAYKAWSKEPDLASLAEYLEPAAQIASDLFAKLGVDSKNIGNICPIIYHYFIKPEKVDKALLIKELVKCTLRERGKQEDVLEPVYINEYTELEIDEWLLAYFDVE